MSMHNEALPAKESNGVHWLKSFHPGFVVRMIGGAIFLSGMLLMAWNTWRTVRAAQPADVAAAAQMA